MTNMALSHVFKFNECRKWSYAFWPTCICEVDQHDKVRICSTPFRIFIFGSDWFFGPQPEVITMTRLLKPRSCLKFQVWRTQIKYQIYNLTNQKCNTYLTCMLLCMVVSDAEIIETMPMITSIESKKDKTALQSRIEDEKRWVRIVEQILTNHRC